MASVKDLFPWHSAPVFLPVMHSVQSVSLEQAVNSAQQAPSKHVWQGGVGGEAALGAAAAALGAALAAEAADGVGVRLVVLALGAGLLAGGAVGAERIVGAGGELGAAGALEARLAGGGLGGKPHLALPPAPALLAAGAADAVEEALYLALLLQAAPGLEEVAQLLQSTSSKQALSTSQHLASTQVLQVGKPSGRR
jgi:hypothetical protein